MSAECEGATEDAVVQGRSKDQSNDPGLSQGESGQEAVFTIENPKFIIELMMHVIDKLR